MDWKPPFAAGLLTFVLALLAFYPLLVVHFVEHHAETWDQAILHATFGHHAPQALIFAIPFLLIGFVFQRRVLAAEAGRAVLLPTIVGATLGALVVSAGPPPVLAVGFLSAFLGFAGALVLSPARAPRRTTPHAQ